jgi:flagellar biosynthesis/type III secretory pathway M-ring protein FliF/YscJ
VSLVFLLLFFIVYEIVMSVRYSRLMKAGGVDRRAEKGNSEGPENDGRAEKSNSEGPENDGRAEKEKIDIILQEVSICSLRE